jgi:hypothetical protein
MSSHKDLIEIIDIRIKKYLNEFIYINEKIGIITSLVDDNGKHKVKIDEIEYDIPKKNNDNTTYQIGDSVIVRFFNGNFSRKYIESKKPNW